MAWFPCNNSNLGGFKYSVNKYRLIDVSTYGAIPCSVGDIIIAQAIGFGLSATNTTTVQSFRPNSDNATHIFKVTGTSVTFSYTGDYGVGTYIFVLHTEKPLTKKSVTSGINKTLSVDENDFVFFSACGSGDVDCDNGVIVAESMRGGNVYRAGIIKPLGDSVTLVEQIIDADTNLLIMGI